MYRDLLLPRKLSCPLYKVFLAALPGSKGAIGYYKDLPAGNERLPFETPPGNARFSCEGWHRQGIYHTQECYPADCLSKSLAIAMVVLVAREWTMLISYKLSCFKCQVKDDGQSFPCVSSCRSSRELDIIPRLNIRCRPRPIYSLHFY